jgi:DNA-directed RNA polymerase I, II, and III subunit RPABC1
MSFNLEIQANIVLKKMLLDRGFTDIEESKENFSLFGKDSDGNKILTSICNEDKVSIQSIKDFISIMNKDGYHYCIIIYRDSVTSSAKKSLEIMEYNIELFNINELQLNITEHRLVPKHEKPTKEEIEFLDKNYKGKLPIILTTDPISRYYHYKRGEYIKITRQNGNILYRLVK